MQDFELESLLMGADIPLMVKAAPIKSDYRSEDCVKLSSPTAVFRLIDPQGEELYHDRTLANDSSVFLTWSSWRTSEKGISFTRLPI